MSQTSVSVMHDPAIWTDAVANYEALAEPHTSAFARAALDFAGGVSPGERVLDVAAGTGALTLEAAADGAQVLATDFAPGMIERLQARLAEAGLDKTGCEARVMDGQALDLPDDSFDAAFSVFGVILFPDWEQGLRELHRVVRPGGRVVVVTWARAQGAGPAILFHKAWLEALPGREPPPFPPGLYALKEPEGLEAAMRAAGSSSLRIQSLERAWTITSADWLADNADKLFKQFPSWAGLNDAERLLVRERLRGTGGTSPGVSFTVPSHALVAVGTR